MTEEKNDVLAICFRKDPHRDQPHSFSVVLSQNNAGDYEEVTRMDFTGQMEWKNERFEQAVFLPITKQTATVLKDVQETVTARVNKPDKGTMPFGREIFYHSESGDPLKKFEIKGKQPLEFDGAPLDEDIDIRAFENADNKPRVATNCMDWLTNTLQQIGGVPLDGILPRDISTKRTIEFAEWIDSEIEEYSKNAEAVREYSTNSGNYFLYRNQNSQKTDTLNQITHQVNPLLDTLSDPKQSPPFYDPSLNDGITEHPDYKPKPETSHVSCDSSSPLIDNSLSQSIQ